jgi:hypothetical protein
VKAASRFVALPLLVVLCSPAAAHLGLHDPPSRYGENILKIAPCGRGGGQRSTNVTTFEPGATIEVLWDEYVDHPGHFRIAFDDDGDDDFADPRCLRGCNSTTPTIELYADSTVLLDGIPDTPRGGESGARVTLPDIECDNCTLQVIQVMYDKPPYVSPGNDIYYQCADLVLRRGVVVPTPTASPSPSPPPPPCIGDCDGDGAVGVDDVLKLIVIALGEDEAAACLSGDGDASGSIEVDEIVAALQRSLNGCGGIPVSGF